MLAPDPFWFLVHLLLLYFIPAATSAQHLTGNSWSNVISTSGYQLLPDCAKPCVLNVDSLNTCHSFDCVCSENTDGPRFIAGVTNIASCAKQACKLPAEAKVAVNTFRDICLVAMGLLTSPPLTNSTLVRNSSTINVKNAASTPVSASLPNPSTLLIIKAATYDNLSSCSRFSLNSCRDASASISEQNCGTDKQPQDWNLYRGLAYELGCTTPSCICLGGAFNISYGKLYQASLEFCNTLPTTKNYDSPEYDRLQGVLADYCMSNGMSPNGYIFPFEGNADNSKLLHPDLSSSDKIALGVGLGVGLAGLAMQSVATYYSVKTYSGDEKYRKNRQR